jgi:hypothetical protein
MKKIIFFCFILLSTTCLGAEVNPFLKKDIDHILISIKSNDESLLNIKISKDGFIGRQGNGEFPVIKTSVIAQSNGEVFNTLIESLNEEVFKLANIYDHPDKSGIPITYSVIFVGQKPNAKTFEFRVGTETKNVGDLLPYFGKFIARSVKLTDEIYSHPKEK